MRRAIQRLGLHSDEERRKELEEIDKTTRKLKALGIDEVAAPAPRGIDAIIARAEQRRDEKIKAEKEMRNDEKGLKELFTKDV